MDLPRNIEARPASGFSASEIASSFNRCFEGYVVPVEMTEDALKVMIPRNDVDLTSSTLFLEDEAVAALALVSQRGRISRVAAFGVAPEYRRRGLGRAAMEAVIRDRRAYGDEALVLEVIEQNPPALALYDSLGFRRTRRLAGYVLDDTQSERTPQKSGALESISPAVFARKCREEGDAGLPWQISAESFSHPAQGDEAYKLDGAYCLIGATSGETVALKGLVVDRRERSKGRSSALISALREVHPGKVWNVAALVPDDLAPDFFERNGFSEGEISQQEMRLDLNG